MAGESDLIGPAGMLGERIFALTRQLNLQSLTKHEQVWLSAWIAEASIAASDRESCEIRADECLEDFINKFEKEEINNAKS